MIIAPPTEKVDAALALLTAEGENSWLIGEIATRQGDEEQVEII